MLMLNWISSACIVQAGQAGPLYVLISLNHPSWWKRLWIVCDSGERRGAMPTSGAEPRSGAKRRRPMPRPPPALPKVKNGQKMRQVDLQTTEDVPGPNVSLVSDIHLKCQASKINWTIGPWLWHSWQSGRFRHQRSAVRIPTSAMNYFECISVNCFPEKTKIKKKRLGMAQLKKKWANVICTVLRCNAAPPWTLKE